MRGRAHRPTVILIFVTGRISPGADTGPLGEPIVPEAQAVGPPVQEELAQRRAAGGPGESLQGGAPARGKSRPRAPPDPQSQTRRRPPAPAPSLATPSLSGASAQGVPYAPPDPATAPPRPAQLEPVVQEDLEVVVAQPAAHSQEAPGAPEAQAIGRPCNPRGARAANSRRWRRWPSRVPARWGTRPGEGSTPHAARPADPDPSQITGPILNSR